ncbi:hypothetical protein 1 [Hubei tombus-like virus 43]|uniref:hypothetical protein 1 n=1 Tax=Hubei tombus-like virus 43 TaxID=1923291 RepID=UPI00090968B0|nr:hypothetical protein 1 [Hubei tombus-like virus 43]APG76473.1 hypothetical protein 1 [Hubei tombus-like virus 43]
MNIFTPARFFFKITCSTKKRALVSFLVLAASLAAFVGFLILLLAFQHVDYVPIVDVNSARWIEQQRVTYAIRSYSLIESLVILFTSILNRLDLTINMQPAIHILSPTMHQMIITQREQCDYWDTALRFYDEHLKQFDDAGSYSAMFVLTGTQIAGLAHSESNIYCRGLSRLGYASLPRAYPKSWLRRIDLINSEQRFYNKIAMRLDMIYQLADEIIVGVLDNIMWVLRHPFLSTFVVLLGLFVMMAIGFYLSTLYHIQWSRKIKNCAFAIRQSAPLLPFRPGVVKDVLKRRLKPLKVTPTPDGHLCMAEVRRNMERTCIGFLLEYFKQVRDIGGSPTRNSHYGRRLHICCPDLTAIDHDKVNIANYKNDVQCHKSIDCNVAKQIPAAIMSYVDFHIPIHEIADSVTGPTLVITHEFKEGMDEKWFDGECTVKASGGLVQMSVRGGNEYSHYYHDWKDEGVIIGKSHAINYIKVAKYEHSIVILLWPVTGTFTRYDPNALFDLRYDEISLPDGSSVVNTGKHFEVKDNMGGHLGLIPVDTIVRTAFTAKGMARDPKYVANVDALLRARFTQDKCDMSLLPQASLVTYRLADDYSLTMNHMSSVIDGPVVGLTTMQRLRCATLTLIKGWTPRRFMHLYASLLRWCIGSDQDSSWLPWLWTDHVAPNYEVYTPGSLSLMEIKQNKQMLNAQPFQLPGQSCSTHSAPNNECAAVKHVRKPTVKRVKESTKDQTPATSSTHRKPSRGERKNDRSAAAVAPEPTQRLGPSRRIPDRAVPNAGRRHQQSGGRNDASGKSTADRRPDRRNADKVNTRTTPALNDRGMGKKVSGKSTSRPNSSPRKSKSVVHAKELQQRPNIPEIRNVDKSDGPKEHNPESTRVPFDFRAFCEQYRECNPPPPIPCERQEQLGPRSENIPEIKQLPSVCGDGLQ